MLKETNEEIKNSSTICKHSVSGNVAEYIRVLDKFENSLFSDCERAGHAVNNWKLLYMHYIL